MAERQIELKIVGDSERLARFMTTRAQADFHKRYRRWRIGRLTVTWKKRLS